MGLYGGIVRWAGAGVDPGDCRALAAGLNNPVAGPAQEAAGDGAWMVWRPHRLIDDDDATQPGFSPSNRYLFVFSGLLANRDDLAAALGPGDDTELLGRALDAWGVEAPARLVGEYALAAWDAHTSRLLLARAPFGRHGLFWHRGRDFVAFATTPRALLALPAIPRALDLDTLTDFLIDTHDAGDGSFWAGISRIANGGAAFISADGERIWDHWRPDPAARLVLNSDGAYVEAARALLDQAVACRLPRHGQVGSMLTGGLDSSALAATAARLIAPAPLPSFTQAPPLDWTPPVRAAGRYTDERPFVAAMAATHANLIPHVLDSQIDNQATRDPETAFLLAGHPLRNITNIAWFDPMMAAAQAAGITVLLAGGGGNMTLSWDGLRGLDTLWRRRRYLTLARALWATSRYTGLSMKHLAWWQIARHRVPAWLFRRPGAAPWPVTSAINPDFAARMGVARRLAERAFDADYRQPGDGRAIRLQTLRSLGRQSDVGGGRRDLLGIDIRHPLFDTRLVEFCLAIPEDQFLRNGQTRWLARRVLADRLPPALLNNRQRGAQAPDWHRQMWAQRAAMAAHLERVESSPLARQVMDLPRLRALLDALPEDAAAAEGRRAQYLAVLHRGLHIARFIHWAEGGNG